MHLLLRLSEDHPARRKIGADSNWSFPFGLHWNSRPCRHRKRDQHMLIISVRMFRRCCIAYRPTLKSIRSVSFLQHMCTGSQETRGGVLFVHFLSYWLCVTDHTQLEYKGARVMCGLSVLMRASTLLQNNLIRRHLIYCYNM